MSAQTETRFKATQEVMAELNVNRGWLRYHVDRKMVVSPIRVGHAQLYTDKQIKILRDYREGK